MKQQRLAVSLVMLSLQLLAYAHEFNIHCNDNLVMYWGQNSHGATNPGENQLPLDEYCDKDAGDLIVLSFLSEFNADGLHPPGLNFANSCTSTFDNSTLLHCSNIGKAVAKCQRRGKKVLLSLGGAAGAYGFASDAQAEHYADRVWDTFLGGYSDARPFDQAVLDGIDLDIEGGSSVGYVRFVQRLRERFIESPGRRFYVSAAPQCPYPDFYTGPVLDNAFLDMVFVQFYNNYCGVDKPNWFNFEQWDEWANTVSANKDVRVYLGIPGSSTAASTGYMDIDKLEGLVKATRGKFGSFGGMMMWDMSQADTNMVTKDMSFVGAARELLDSGRKCTDGSDKIDATSSSSSAKSCASSSESESTHQEVGEVSGDDSDSVAETTTIIEDVSDSASSSKSSSNMSSSTSKSSTNSSDRKSSVSSHRIAKRNIKSTSEPADDDPVVEETVIEDVENSSSVEDDAETTEETAEASGGDDSAEEVVEEEVESDESASSSSSADDGNETRTVQTTKVIHETLTRTRRVHLITKHVTTRVPRPMAGQTPIIAASETATSTISNRTTSIVTPTFPLPLARCPRADQPCIGAGFACNGYEFGQCVNGRWLMRPCSMDRVTACFNAGPDLIACDFPKGRSLQVCDDILSPLPYGRLASNVLFLRGSDQERALSTSVFMATPTPNSTTHVHKKKDDDDDDSDESDEDDDDYIYNKYGEKKKNTSTSSVTDMEVLKQSAGVNLIDEHNRREDPAMLMAKDPGAYFGPDGHVRAVGGNVVDDLRSHNSFGTESEPYDENPPVDDPEEADEYSEADEFMRKRDLSGLPTSLPFAGSNHGPTGDLTGASVSMAHLGEDAWRAQLEDFYALYALHTAQSGVTNDLSQQQFERVILDHIDGDFLVPPRMRSMPGNPILARFSFVPLRGEDPDFMHYRTKDGQVSEEVLVVVRSLTNDPIPRRWRIALPLPLNSTILHVSRGSFYASTRVSGEVKSLYAQRVSFYNEHIRLSDKTVELQRLNDLAAGHSTNVTDRFAHEFDDGPLYSSVKRNLISSSVISSLLHAKPEAPPPPELLDEPIPNDPAGHLFEVRSNPDSELANSMALSFTIRVKTLADPGQHVVSALPHPLLSFITTY